MHKKHFSKRVETHETKGCTRVTIKLFLLAFFVLIAAIFTVKNLTEHKTGTLTSTAEFRRLRYWRVAFSKWHDNDPLRTMNRVFERLGYEFVNASNGDDWDILWSIEHQSEDYDSPQKRFLFNDVFHKQLKREQKINHFDGINILTMKSYMTWVNRHLPYILPAFYMPADRKKLREFLTNNPNASIVMKDNWNRGVKIVRPTEVNISSETHFYQQFMDDPFLIDGHAFDFGVFVLITSFDPLRIYRYATDVLFRFCSKKYQPFDAKDRDRYVVKDGAFNAYEMLLFAEIYKQFSAPFIKIFEMHLQEKGYNIKEMWKKIDDAIVKVIRNLEDEIMQQIRSVNHSTQNYFEIVRFDFIFDRKLNPYVMEVNMSPNLTPASDRYEENCNMYEQLVYDAVRMIGGESRYEFTARLKESDSIMKNKKNIAVDIDQCLRHNCSSNCSDQKCSICLPCTSEESRFQMHEAFREHTHRGNFKRLFPAQIHFDDAQLLANLTANNRVSVEWFRAKCANDKKWC